MKGRRPKSVTSHTAVDRDFPWRLCCVARDDAGRIFFLVIVIDAEGRPPRAALRESISRRFRRAGTARTSRAVRQVLAGRIGEGSLSRAKRDTVFCTAPANRGRFQLKGEAVQRHRLHGPAILVSQSELAHQGLRAVDDGRAARRNAGTQAVSYCQILSPQPSSTRLLADFVCPPKLPDSPSRTFSGQSPRISGEFAQKLKPAPSGFFVVR